MAGGYAAGAVLSLLAPSARIARWTAAAGAIAGSLGGLSAALGVLVNGQTLTFSIPYLIASAGGLQFGLDRLGAVFLVVVAAIGALSAVYGVTYTAEYDERRSLRAFGVMFNGFLLGMSLVTAAANVFTFLLAWELMAVASYFLVMTEHDDADTRQAGLWYIAMTHFGLVVLLPMFLLLAPSAEATTFADLRAHAAVLPAGIRNTVFVLALLAFGSKAGLVPLHVWLPRAHPAAPSHVSALMSAVMIKLGVYGFLRVVVDMLGAGPAWWGGLALVAGSLSALGGILYALTENDLKRLLAYSSIENVGIIFIGLGAGLVLHSYGFAALAFAAYGAALLHTVNHAAFKALLFLGAGNVLQQTHTRNMEQMGGLVKRMPATAALFLVGSAAAAALPPLNGFASEWMIFQSLLAGGQIPPPGGAIGTPLAIAVLALTSGLAAACFVKAFGISFLAMPRGRAAAQAHESHASGLAVMTVLALGCVILGLSAPPLVAHLSDIAADVSRFAPGPAAMSSRVWLIAPGGVAQMSPALVALLLAGVVVVAAAAVRLRGLAIRYADTWGCGRIRQTPRMEYTSSAFAEPLRRVFTELFRPTEDLSVSVDPASRYVVRSITYSSAIVPWVERLLYDPLTRATRAAAVRVRRLQAGSVHLYLLYVMTALIAALVSAWWFR
jgi:hydrogenase-4 component B